MSFDSISFSLLMALAGFETEALFSVSVFTWVMFVSCDYWRGFSEFYARLFENYLGTYPGLGGTGLRCGTVFYGLSFDAFLSLLRP